MGVSVVFEGGGGAVEVVPGEVAQVGVRVENTGMVVDRVVLDVLGDAAEWALVEPAQVNLLPGAAEHVRISFQPPRAASVMPGEVAFAVRAMSTEDPEGSSIEEGHVLVGEFGDLGAQLVPKSATGRRSARFRLVVENRGNRPEPIRVEPFDPEAKLGFKTRPGTFVAQPGTATFVRVKAVPRKPFFRGPNRTLPFEVTALPEEGGAATDAGAMLEKQTLPEWLFPLVGIAAVLGGLLLVLWFAVLRPVVNSAATSAGAASSAQAQAQNAAGAASAAAKAASNSNAKLGALTALTVKIASPAVLTGNTDLATASGTAAGGAGSNPKVVWASANPSVATVSQNGVVTAVSPGTATITATDADAGASASASPGSSATPQPTLDLGAPGATDSATPGGGTGIASAAVVSGSVTVNVVGPVSVSTVTLPQGVLGKTYSESLNGTGGTGSYIWTVSTGSLPPGFSLSPDGILSGTPSAIGTTTFKVQMVNTGPPYQTAAKTFTLPVIDAPAVQTSSLPGATKGVTYGFPGKSPVLKAVFGTPPYTWSLVPGQGDLPAGLNLDPTTGEISGSATTVGVSTFSVQVTDSAARPQSATQQLSIAVSDKLIITTPATLPQEGVKGEPYALTLGATGGGAPYAWSVETGSNLPLGLTLSPSGVISGIPTIVGKNMRFMVQVVSTGPPAQTVSESVSLTVVEAPVVATSSLPGAITGEPYSRTLTAKFGTGPSYTWSVVPGQGDLPTGLQLNSNTGAITGTVVAAPAIVGTYSFIVQATDSTTPQQSATQRLSIVVANPLAVTTPAALPQEGVKGEPYALALGATGGTGPLTWSVTGGSTAANSLPAGLTLNSASGVISGTPAVSGTFAFTVQLADAGVPTQVVSIPVSLTVVVPPAVATSSLLDATTGTVYSQTLTAAFGTGPYTWSLVPGQGVLPDGLSLTTSNQITQITGSPTTAGTYSFIVQATDSTTPQQSATQRLSIAVAGQLSISTVSLPGGVVGTPYSAALSASGGTQPYTWSLSPNSGSLPPGLSLDPATGVISGIPTGRAQSAFSVTVTDSGKTNATPNPQRTAPSPALSLFIVDGLVGTTSNLPQGAVKQPYNDNSGDPVQLTATGGTPVIGVGGATSYVWSATGTLPPGLNLSADGQITGTPTMTGLFPFTVQITDASSPPLTATESLSITVTGSLKVTTQSLPDALAGEPYSQTLTATGGIAPYTWSWAAVSGDSLPAGLSLDPVTGVISGTAPTTIAAVKIMVTVTDTGPPQQSQSQPLTIAVSPPLTFTLHIPSAVVIGQSVGLAPSGQGGSGPYVWTESGVLPAGLDFDSSTGAISGTVQNVKDAPGTFPFQLTMSDQAGGLPPKTGHFSITVVAPLSSRGPVGVPAEFGTAFHQAIQPSGGLAPFTFDATDLPSWMSIDPSTGVISGTSPDVQCSTTMDDAKASTLGQTDTFSCAPAAPPGPATVTIKDSLGETATVTVNPVVNAPPLAVDHVISVNQLAAVKLSFSVGTVSGGYPGGAVTYSAIGLPCDVPSSSMPPECDQIDPNTGVVTGSLTDIDKYGNRPILVTVTQHDPTPGSTDTFVGQYTVTIDTLPSTNNAASPDSGGSAGATP